MRQHFRWSLLVLAALIGVSVWATMLWLLRPLGRLHAAMTQLSATDLRSTSPLEQLGASAEIDAVSTAFHKPMGGVVRQCTELETVNDASLLGLFRSDVDGRTVYTNEAYRRLLGATHEEALADVWLAYLHPDDRDAIIAGWRSALAREAGYRAERHVIVSGLGERLLVVTTAPVRVDGEVVGHAGAMEDIIVRARTQQTSRVLTKILDSTTDFVVQSDIQGNVTYMNPAGRHFAGTALDVNLQGLTVADFYLLETMSWLHEVAVPAAARDGVWTGETTARGAGDQVVPTNHMIIAHRDPAGRMEYFSPVMRNITQDKVAKEALQRSHETLQTVTDAPPALVAFIDTDERFRFLNAAYEKAYGRSAASMLGWTLREVVGDDVYNLLRDVLRHTLGGETMVFEHELRGRDLHRCEEVGYLPQFDTQGRMAGVHSIMLDITERKKQELRLRALTTTDHLTGLANRAGLEERLLTAFGQVRVTGSTGALLLVDLDGFKVIDDMHGYAVGDALLRTFAQRLARAMRPYDGVACFGGDEFTVILERLSHPDDAKAAAANTLSTCNKPLRWREAMVQVSASIGITIFNMRTLAQSVAFETADETLYEVKSRGKGLFVSANELSVG